MNRRVRLNVGLGRTCGTATVCIWIANFHHTVGCSKWPEAKLRVQSICITSSEQHPAEALKVGMLNDLLHQASGETFASVRGQDVDVRKRRERRLVGYDASKAHLLTVAKHTKTEGVVYRAFDYRARNTGRPVRVREEVVNRAYVQARFVAGDFVCGHRELCALTCKVTGAPH
jgi:hypothetical protein